MKIRLIYACTFAFAVLLSACDTADETPSTSSPVTTAEEVRFVGSSSCMQCHTAEFKDWQQSDHKLAMQIATPDTVLGDFKDVKVDFHDIETRFFQQGDDYQIETIGKEGKAGIFPVKYTFGHYPLQQYLVDIGNGHLQALNVAWDSRPDDEGGQRWFHLQPDEAIDPEHPFFWSAHFQNWNSRCAECHSTDLKKNFDPLHNRYDTKWSEISIGCEACHGAGSQHVTLAEKGALGDDSSFAKQMSAALSWTFKGDDDIASSSGVRRSDHVNMCGGCHSRRSIVGELEPLGEFHDQYRLSLLDDGLYFPDGQINDEVYVLGSFLQSKMHAKGVTCSDCHNPHSGKLRAKGNGLCMQCHKPTTYDVADHHHHSLESVGALCVSCHMPERTYMSVDPRRDHSFGIPNPALSIRSGVPNACMNCHKDKSDDWSVQAMTKWGVAQPSIVWPAFNEGLSSEDIALFKEYAQGSFAGGMAPIRQATLLEKLSAFPSRLAMETASDQLTNPDPLVRRAAVIALQPMPLNIRWKLLLPLVTDPVRAVRFDVARVLADGINQLPEGEVEQLRSLIADYRESLAYDADSPGGQVAIGILEARTGNLANAEQAYQQALSIEPQFVPALINLADYYRSIGKNKESSVLLARAVEIAPDSANTNHAYGLLLVRAGKYQEAVEYFKTAVTQEDARPNHAYVYAVALDSLGQTEEAMTVIDAADHRWPNHMSLSTLQVSLMDKSGRTDGIHHYLSLLVSVSANDPQVRAWAKKYSGTKPDS